MRNKSCFCRDVMRSKSMRSKSMRSKSNLHSNKPETRSIASLQKTRDASPTKNRRRFATPTKNRRREASRLYKKTETLRYADKKPDLRSEASLQKTGDVKHLVSTKNRIVKYLFICASVLKSIADLRKTGFFTKYFLSIFFILQFLNNCFQFC